MADEALSSRIARKLNDGTLPLRQSDRIWAGYGRAELCSACDLKIVPAQVAYEVRCGGQILCFHIGCHALWEIEVSRQARWLRQSGEASGKPPNAA